VDTQLIPSALGEEAAAALDKLLRGRAEGNPSDSYFARDWQDLWNELAENDWTTIADRPAQEDDDDSTFSLLDLTAIAEVWGAHLVPLPFMPTLAVRRWLDDRPDPSQRLSYVAAEQGCTVLVHGEGTEHVLAGVRLLRSESLPMAISVDRWAESLPLSVLPAGLDPAPKALRIDAAVLAASEAVGAAANLLNRTVEYAKVREQFGQPIGRFQAVKHRLANMHCNVEMARSAVVWACSQPDRTATATIAAVEYCLRVTEDSIQVHGGIGFTWEAVPHWYYRHVMSLRRVVVASVGTP
jgi:hypothetical protein